VARPHGPPSLFSTHFALLIAAESTLGAVFVPLFGQSLLQRVSVNMTHLA
jgi:hypothetical protein